MGPTLGTAFQECRIGESQFCVIDEKKEFHWRRKVVKVDTNTNNKNEEKQQLLPTNGSTNGSTSASDTDGGTIDGEKIIKTVDSKKLLDNLNSSTNVQHSEDFSQVKLAGLESTMSQGQDFVIPDGMYGDTNIVITGELSDNTRNRSITPLNTNEISQTESVSNSNYINNDNENNIDNIDNNDINEIENMREEATPDTIVEEPIPQDLFMNTENMNENNNVLNNNNITITTGDDDNINNSSDGGGIVNTNYNNRSISIEERNEKRNSLIVPDNAPYSQKSVQEMQDLLRDYENQQSVVDFHKQRLSRNELANLKKNSDLDTSTGNEETEDESSDMDSESSDGGERGTQHNVTSLGAPRIEIRQQSIEEMEMQLQALKLQNSLRDQNLSPKHKN